MADEAVLPTPGAVAAVRNVTGGNNKTVGIALANSICVILAWVVKEKFGIDVPADVQAATQGLISLIVVYAIPHSNSAGAAN